jgi:hypothetical protein
VGGKLASGCENLPKYSSIVLAEENIKYLLSAKNTINLPLLTDLQSLHFKAEIS